MICSAVGSRDSHPSACAVHIRLTAYLLALLVVTAGCAVSGSTASGVSTADVTQLEALTLIPRPQDDGSYRRAYFGPAWADTDHSGCRQRADVLYRDVDRSQPYTTRRSGRCAHEMVAGTWKDPYSGEMRTFANLRDTKQAQQIPIDHTLSLAAMWRYGAKDWTDQQRSVAANDLDNLVPTTERMNAAKGGKDAASWRPPRFGQCGFARRYVIIKKRYSLPVDVSERAALRQMLVTCT